MKLTLLDEREQHDKRLHDLRMHADLLVRQRDEARDEASLLRSTSRKSKKGRDKSDDEREREQAKRKIVRGSHFTCRQVGLPCGPLSPFRL